MTEDWGPVISSAIMRSEARQLKKKGIEYTELQRRALRERAAYLTAVKHGYTFKPLPPPEKDHRTTYIK